MAEWRTQQFQGDLWPPTPLDEDDFRRATFERGGQARTSWHPDPDDPRADMRCNAWVGPVDARGRREMGTNVDVRLTVHYDGRTPYNSDEVLADINPNARRLLDLRAKSELILLRMHGPQGEQAYRSLRDRLNSGLQSISRPSRFITTACEDWHLRGWAPHGMAGRDGLRNRLRPPNYGRRRDVDQRPPVKPPPAQPAQTPVALPTAVVVQTQPAQTPVALPTAVVVQAQHAEAPVALPTAAVGAAQHAEAPAKKPPPVLPTHAPVYAQAAAVVVCAPPQLAQQGPAAVGFKQPPEGLFSDGWDRYFGVFRDARGNAIADAAPAALTNVAAPLAPPPARVRPAAGADVRLTDRNLPAQDVRERQGRRADAGAAQAVPPPPPPPPAGPPPNWAHQAFPSPPMKVSAQAQAPVQHAASSSFLGQLVHNAHLGSAPGTVITTTSVVQEGGATNTVMVLQPPSQQDRQLAIDTPVPGEEVIQILRHPRWP